MQLGIVRKEIRERGEALEALIAEMAPWSPLIHDLENRLRPFLEIREIRGFHAVTWRV